MTTPTWEDQLREIYKRIDKEAYKRGHAQAKVETIDSIETLRHEYIHEGEIKTPVASSHEGYYNQALDDVIELLKTR